MRNVMTLVRSISFGLAFLLAYFAGARGLAFAPVGLPTAATPQIFEEICFGREGRAGDLEEFDSDEELRDVIATCEAWLAGEVPGRWSTRSLAGHLDSIFGGMSFVEDPEYGYEWVKDSTCVYQKVCTSVAEITLDLGPEADPIFVRIRRWMEAP